MLKFNDAPQAAMGSTTQLPPKPAPANCKTAGSFESWLAAFRKEVTAEGLSPRAIAAVLDRTCPEAPFIPEIWQGHKNEGEGSWIALERLEGLF